MADFSVINKLTVAIASHRVQLQKADNSDDIDRICAAIASLETEIMVERKKELKALTVKKEDLLQKMAALESELDGVNREINARVSRYREAVTARITQLENEVNGKKSELDTPTIE